ncbi:MAG TPA: beta-ketoacyl-[acyl-carrier-protein] synthase family protein [Thermoanaerobaculia bacterium]
MTSAPPHRVVITGAGCVTSLGVGKETFWDALTAGRCAIRPTRVSRDGIESVFPAAPVGGYDPNDHFTGEELLWRDPFAQYAQVAAREAMNDAGLAAGNGHHLDTAVILGTGGGGEHAREEAGARLFAQRRMRAHPVLVPKANLQAAVGFISIEYGAMGPSFVVSTGCAAATHAIAQAYLIVKNGLAARAITGGSEAPIMISILQAFNAAQVLSQSTCRPFSRERDGMVLADGAGVVVLETLEGARARGAHIYGELAGVGMSADAANSVHPDARGPANALERAFADARVNAADIDYINAHGTGTAVNDRVETEAVKRAFGSHARKVPISSTKSMHGHAFGGVGGIELVATLLAMKHGVLPPTVNYLGGDEDCDLDYVPNFARDADVRTAVSQSFAFGGLNAVLVVKRDVEL